MKKAQRNRHDTIHNVKIFNTSPVNQKPVPGKADIAYLLGLEDKEMENITEKVLIIDGEAGLRRNLQFGLTQEGFSIDDVEDGLSALHLIESSFNEGKPYNYVIADINLPDINGLKLLEVIKSKYPSLPVIMITGYGTEVTMDEVSIRHGDGYLSKPFLIGDLTDVMGKVAPKGSGDISAEEETAHKTSVSAYVMLKIKESADIMGLFRKLYFMDNVLYCDAVRDVYDIVLLLNGDTYADLENIVQTKIKPLADIEEIDYSPILPPTIEPDIKDFLSEYEKQQSVEMEEEKKGKINNNVLAYALLEIEKDKFNRIYPILYFLDGVISCDTSKGKYDVILLLKSQTFKEMERIVHDEIRPIDGIIRTRLLNVMNMFTM